MPPSLVSLKRRADFLRVRGGARCDTSAFVLEAKPRGRQDGSLAANRPRFGFTVTKRLGRAVLRNRIKRRLRAAARDVLVQHKRPDFDYVVIARSPALDTSYAVLVCNLRNALEHVHKASHGQRKAAEA